MVELPGVRAAAGKAAPWARTQTVYRGGRGGKVPEDGRRPAIRLRYNAAR